MHGNRNALYFLLLLGGIALFFCYRLVAPFLKPVFFAIVLAIIFQPVYARIRRRIRNRNAAALLSTAALVLIVVVASALLGRAIFSGLQEMYQSLSDSGAGKERLTVFVVQLFNRAISWAGHYLPLSVSDLQRAVLAHTEGAIGGLLAFSGSLATRATSLIVDMAVTVFVLFFLLRDGRTLLRKGAVLVPLRREQVRRLFIRIKTTLYAIVYGTIAMAAIQGALTGVAFWILGLAAPVLWGVIAGLCALLPVIGTTMVLLPAVCMLLFSGYWIKAIILAVWGLLIVHPVDNILRPYLIGDRARLSMLMVFFALFGGLEAFGPVGLFVGPLILSLTVASFTFLREDLREERHAGNWIVGPVVLTRPVAPRQKESVPHL